MRGLAKLGDHHQVRTQAKSQYRPASTAATPFKARRSKASTRPMRFEPGAPPDPMMLAMNALGYDAMALGNHEFNYGLGTSTAPASAASFPWLSANTKVHRGSTCGLSSPT